VRFWERLACHGDAVALIDGSVTWTYARLARAVAERVEGFRSSHKKLAALTLTPDNVAIVDYLALLCAGHAVLLLDDPAHAAVLTARYQPDWILETDSQHVVPNGYRPTSLYSDTIVLEPMEPAAPSAPDLALLLSTSGSAGASKCVRLSYANIAAAADQVTRVLAIASDDRAVTSIPLTHVYGLSVLHGQLAAGGSLLLTGRSALQPAFWEDVQCHRVTMMAGVPWTYDIMRALKMDAAQLPDLRKLHQSGARLSGTTAAWMPEAFPDADIFFMYGQTEAAGRIAVLPPSLARAKPGSVGRAVPGGTLSLGEGEAVLYRGPNVMLGYAETRADLGRGDDMGGVLPTGDLGRLDEDGLLYLTGRANRLCKIMGLRINLDALQSDLARYGAVAVTGDDEILSIFHEGNVPALNADDLARDLRLPRQAIRLRPVVSLPRLAGGKIDFAALAQSIA
jgi:acyl-CoA synthetase (AMP-forming)/AMP-acid ligase II